jgi:hypothetical protein
MTVSWWSERAEAVSGIRSTQLAGSKLVQDLLAASRHIRIFLLDLEAHGRHDLVQAGDDGRVGNTQFLFDVFDLAAAADEDFDELELFARQAGQAAEGEVALQGRAAGLTFQAHNT